MMALTCFAASAVAVADVADIYVDQASTLGAYFDDEETFDYVGDFASGRDSILDVYFESFYAADSIVGFDLSPLYNQLSCGETITINSVSLSIAETADSYSNIEFWVDGLLDDGWDEETITWNDVYEDANFLHLGVAEFLYRSDDYLPAISLEITNEVQSDYLDDGYLTLVLRASDFTFTSPGELYGADTDKEPFITVDYDVIAGSNPRLCEMEKRAEERAQRREIIERRRERMQR